MTITEPRDNHTYGAIWLRARTVALIRKGFAHYQALLEKDVEALKADPELLAVVESIDSLPVVQEAKRIARIGEWLGKHIAELPENSDHHLSLDHGHVRLTKSVCLLYINHLRERRNLLSGRSGASVHLLSSIDGVLASLEEVMDSGVFRAASASPLLLDEVEIETTSAGIEPPAVSVRRNHSPGAVVLPSIELLDPELRSRCVDLFATFSVDGQHGRLDTVVTEATRILEHRIRQVSSAPANTVGVELATFAFSGATPRIRVSTISAEQEAAHLMFRGLFGFIRNHVHHRLTGKISPQRVLQILGMIDYLLSLSAGANGAVGGEESI